MMGQIRGGLLKVTLICKGVSNVVGVSLHELSTTTKEKE